MLNLGATGANSGWAILVVNVLQVFVLEVAQCAQHRVGSSLTESAEAGVFHHVAEVDQQVFEVQLPFTRPGPEPA